MESSFASPQSSMNGSSISGNSANSSASGSDKKKRFANSIAKVFRKSSSSSQEEFSEPLLDEEVDSQLQFELQSLKKVHENLGKQASSLGAELAQTRAEAEALKNQLEDATSRLTPSPPRSEASLTPKATTPTSGFNNKNILGSATPIAATASFSPEVVGSPFGLAIHEDILALQAQIDLLTSDIANKDEILKTMEAARSADALTAHSESERLRTLVSKTKQEAEIAEAEAKHCIKQVQSGKEAALVAAATAASDAKVLATRCAALEVTVQRLMEGLENKDKVKSDMEEAMKKLQLSRDVDINELYSVERPSAMDLAAANNYNTATEGSAAVFNESSHPSQASDCEAKLLSDGSATEGMDTASSAITGPLAAGLAAAAAASGITDENKQEASNDFIGTIPAVYSSKDNNNDGPKKTSHFNVVGNGRSFSSGNINAAAPGTNKTKLVMINSSSAAAGKKTSKKKERNSIQEIQRILKSDAAKVVIKGTVGLIILGVLSRLIRGGNGRDGSEKNEARSRQPRQAASGGAASFAHA
ncbi:hypothetical protein NADE_002561 [Nannochloris sp. 'desiccata']|nr:hypothetical protein KSW81_005720 [Chlorella desiccata (nom. nud.)]KAH7623371.1 hypothetical protein NADE_002561 [Chlorella desiccata (nom. nud.)]